LLPLLLLRFRGRRAEGRSKTIGLVYGTILSQ
jgi:hypothetical protein